jgi:hypothetical protein
MVSGALWIASFLAMTVRASLQAQRGNPFARQALNERASLAMTNSRTPIHGSSHHPLGFELSAGLACS